MVTEAFVNLAKAQAEGLGHPNLRMIVIPHPFGGIPEEEIRTRARKSASNIFEALTQPLEEEQSSVEAPSEKESASKELSVTVEEGNELGWELVELELTDGLPVTPPTPDRVERMLEYCDRGSDYVIGPIPPKWSSLSLETAAANAVMAGCKPEHFPVVIQAIEAMLDSRFNLYGIQATTHPVGPLLLLSGPIAQEVGIAGEAGCLGPGWLPNAVIGRAIRLILMNGGGARPGVLDKATMGQPGKFSACFAENEAESPWEPFRVDQGFDPDATTITVIGAEGPHNINDHGSSDAEGILRTVSGTMASTGSNSLYWQGDTFVVLGPEHARTLAAEGLSKQDVQQELHRRARVPAASMSEGQLEHTRGWAGDGDPYVDEDGRVAVTRRAEEICIVVAGGPGKHSMWIPTFGITFSVTRPLTDQANAPIRSVKDLRG